MTDNIKKDLTALLEMAYSKGQAYYRKDRFGSSEDDDMEWEFGMERQYKKHVKEFLKRYGGIKQ